MPPHDRISRIAARNSPACHLHLVAPDAGEGEAGPRAHSILAHAGAERQPAPAAEDLAPAILQRAREGEADAFHAIFHRYRKPVASFLIHLTGDRACVEELAQETFFRTFRGLHRLQEGVKLSTWIFGIARNVAHEALRAARRGRREIGLQDGPHRILQEETPGPDEMVSSGELRTAIRQALLELSEDQRTVFILKMLYRMRYQEISAIMECSIAKLKTDLHRARQRMRKRLQPYLAWKIPEM